MQYNSPTLSSDKRYHVFHVFTCTATNRNINFRPDGWKNYKYETKKSYGKIFFVRRIITKVWVNNCCYTNDNYHGVCTTAVVDHISRGCSHGGKQFMMVRNENRDPHRINNCGQHPQSCKNLLITERISEEGYVIGSINPSVRLFPLINFGIKRPST